MSRDQAERKRLFERDHPARLPAALRRRLAAGLEALAREAGEP